MKRLSNQSRKLWSNCKK